MALNIPMPESPGSSLLQGLDTGSTLMSRIMQPILERERLKQQQEQFAKNYALHQQAQGRAQQLLPLMIQQYKDTHRTAASEADMKDLYRNILKGALQGSENVPVSGGMQPQDGMPPQAGGAPPQIVGNQPNPAQGNIPPQIGAPPNAALGSPDMALPQTPNAGLMAQEHELRAGNPRLAKLDSVAGLVPGIPKPVTHYANGMVFTTYPSGKMTVQKVQGDKTPGERSVSAREASNIRNQATALANSANLVQQGYDLLDKNENLTGPGNFISALHIPFTGAKINLSNNPELGKFTTVTGKLQAELGKYAASRGGIQTIKWVGSVKPDPNNPEDYNYGMFEGIQRNLQDDYNTLNQQYKAATGQNLPVSLPNMKRNRGGKAKDVIVIDPNGKRFKTTKENSANLPEGWSRG